MNKSRPFNDDFHKLIEEEIDKGMEIRKKILKQMGFLVNITTKV